MAIEILQTPADVSLAQSPIVFAVSESLSGSVASSSFQYIAELYYWTGTNADSSSIPQFTLAKYPNTSLSGIFDFSKIINSTLQDPLEANPSNVKYFKAEFYYQYISGSTFITSSHVPSNVYKTIDGYSLYQEPIGQTIEDKTPFWPIMTDGPATQSVFLENIGNIGIYTGIANESAQPDEILYTVGDGVYSVEIPVSSSVSSSQQIQQVPSFPAADGFVFGPYGLGNGDYYTMQAYYDGSPISDSIRFNIECEKKYPNVRIKWKNRYGQFDFLNFNLVSEQSFSTEIRTFQQQIGSWTSPTLSYNNYDSATQNYSADSTENLRVNTDWISEEYNDILKQLMVSDEIYWIYNESSGDLRPITIKTNSISFKTSVKDKLIQYAFDFEFGQSYKLIL